MNEDKGEGEEEGEQEARLLTIHPLVMMTPRSDEEMR